MSIYVEYLFLSSYFYASIIDYIIVAWFVLVRIHINDYLLLFVVLIDMYLVFVNLPIV